MLPPAASQPMKISTPPCYRNSSNQYIIGTVPHPYTIASLANLKDSLDIPWVRRTSERDVWVTALTREILGTGRSAAPRLLRFKEAVASETHAANSLWLTAEVKLPNDLDWRFGFVIPSESTWVEDGKSETPVPGPERRIPPPHDPWMVLWRNPGAEARACPAREGKRDCPGREQGRRTAAAPSS